MAFGISFQDNFDPASQVQQFAANVTNEDTPAVPQGTVMWAEAAEVVLPPEVLLSPESLFMHLRTNLRDMDRQIANQLQLLQGNRDQISKATEVLTRLRADMSESRNHVRDEDGKGNDGIAITDDNRQEYVDMLVTAGLTQSDAEAMVSGWGDYACDDNFKEAIDAVNDQVSEMTSNNEYQMLQVNELMSKRSNLIQLISKIMGSMNETAQSVIQNIR